METLMSAFQLMGERPKQIFKLIGYQLLWTLIFILGIIPCLFLPFLAIAYLPLLTYSALFNYQAHQSLFLEDDEDRLGIILSKTNEVFKERGWRMFGCMMACGFVICLVFIIVAIISLQFIFLQMLGGVDFTTLDLENSIIQIIESELSFKLMANSILLIFTTLGYFFQYVQGFVALGRRSTVRLAFKQIKSILLLVLINAGCLLVPLGGNIAMMVLSVVLPLKIILDDQSNGTY